MTNDITRWAQAALALPTLHFIVIDTTGVEKDSDILRILILDRDGFIVAHEYVRSLRHTKSPNTPYTGITQEMMDNSPQLSLVWQNVKSALTGKYIISYGLDFVQDKFDENAEYYNLQPIYLLGDCLHYNAAAYFRVNHIKLTEACRRIGLRLEEKPGAHDRALGQLTLLRAMAEGRTAPPVQESDEDQLSNLDDHPF